MISAKIYLVELFLIPNTLFLMATCQEWRLGLLSNSSINSIRESHDELLTPNQANAEDNISKMTSKSVTDNDIASNSTDYPYEDECPDLECSIHTRVLLNTEEYILLEDGRIHAHLHKKTFEKCEYFDYEGGVVVCNSKLLENLNITNNRTHTTKKDDRILAIITVIGLSTSVVFIILHLVLFLIIPEMKNLPGCCLASLCVALVLGYVHFLVTSLVDNMSKTSCVGVAMCIYYFFMASFFWMNAIAFDVCRSLREATNHLRALENKFPRKRFLLYSAYAWLTPMTFAILTHLIDSSDHIPQKYRPRFAESQDGWCWFTETHSLMLLFITPFAVLMGLNILFFGVSTYIIITASFNSSQTNRKMLVSKFFVFLRLAVMIGLTWLSAIIVHFTESIAMTYVFVISNVFQGLLIFLAFSCKTTVKKYFFRRVSTFRSRSSTRTKEISQRPSTSSSAV